MIAKNQIPDGARPVQRHCVRSTQGERAKVGGGVDVRGDDAGVPIASVRPTAAGGIDPGAALRLGRVQREHPARQPEAKTDHS